MTKEELLMQQMEEIKGLCVDAAGVFLADGVDRKLAALAATRIAAVCCRANKLDAHTAVELFLTMYKDADKFWKERMEK